MLVVGKGRKETALLIDGVFLVLLSISDWLGRGLLDVARLLEVFLLDLESVRVLLFDTSLK